MSDDAISAHLMPAPEIFSYDAVPYQGAAFAQSHPDRLATIARLFGMQPAPVEKCRVLELGCGDAMNIIPMAYALPGCEFVGVDLSGSAIARGRGAMDALGLKNITLLHADLRDFPKQTASFDYIISHGVYSWVPPGVRDNLLHIMATHLAPQGVAYVSYQCFPGGHTRLMIREMLKFHVAGCADTDRLVTEVREFTKLLESGRQSHDPDNTSYARELEHLLRARKEAVIHDHLSEVNYPVYFHEFASHAGRHGLQFLAEAVFHDMLLDSLPHDVATALNGIPKEQAVTRQQYLDFALCRSFRHTLLCHSGVSLNRGLAPEACDLLLFAACLQPARENPPLDASSTEEYFGPNFSHTSTTIPFAKAVLRVLTAHWPQSLSFAALLAGAQELLSQALGAESMPAVESSTAEELRPLLLKFYSAGLIEFHAHDPRVATSASSFPRASLFARWQALDGELVTSLIHETVRLEDELARGLLRLCDGTRDREALLRALRESAHHLSPEQQSTITLENLEASLEGLARLALLHE